MTSTTPLCDVVPSGPCDLQVSIIHFGPEHEDDFANLLLSLDAHSRILRFGHAASDATLKAYTRKALSTVSFAAGAFVDRELLAVVEVFDCGRQGTAELAFVTKACWRRRGLALTLLGEAKAWAEQRGFHTLRLIFSRKNVPMRGLAVKAAAHLEFELDEISAKISLAAPLRIAT